jgi:hypothetical protein
LLILRPAWALTQDKMPQGSTKSLTQHIPHMTLVIVPRKQQEGEASRGRSAYLWAFIFICQFHKHFKGADEEMSTVALCVLSPEKVE